MPRHNDNVLLVACSHHGFLSPRAAESPSRLLRRHHTLILQPIEIETMGRSFTDELAVEHIRSLVIGEKPPFCFSVISFWIKRYTPVALKGTFSLTHEDETSPLRQ